MNRKKNREGYWSFCRRVGRTVRQPRGKRGFTAEQLNRAAGMDPLVAADIEGGGPDITIATLTVISQALRVDITTVVPPRQTTSTRLQERP